MVLGIIGFLGGIPLAFLVKGITQGELPLGICIGVTVSGFMLIFIAQVIMTGIRLEKRKGGGVEPEGKPILPPIPSDPELKSDLPPIPSDPDGKD